MEDIGSAESFVYPSTQNLPRSQKSPRKSRFHCRDRKVARRVGLMGSGTAIRAGERNRDYSRKQS